MQLMPRYGDDPIIELDGAPSAILEPTVRQRTRLADALGGFSDEDWAHPSRCDGWSNQDVIVHLDSTNAFWQVSVEAALAGEPTRHLASFDPVASPAQLVEGARGRSAAAVLDSFTASTIRLTDRLGSLSDDDWNRIGEAPPGHQSVSAVIHHALWDSWIHERDVLIPLGADLTERDDEVLACLRYAAALGPALAVGRGLPTPATMALTATSPDQQVGLTISDRVRVADRPPVGEPQVTLFGPAVDLVESLSLRRPPGPIPSGVAGWIGGLAAAFDVDPPR